MEDSTNVRVTRLRRRLSVESEDTSSPLTPSTPTKRRGRPAAAKPQLDLIEENVTRLGTRLSVESEDTSSPLTPSTPTKRRGRPAAAKPQLDLIEENVPATTTPSRSKKAIQDVKEQDKPTPTRRSARVKSNTSETVDDKPATPLKRSTRTKSNTSILSESNVNESPRTRRATRRNSVVESDNENKITPARITRRTRKESTSSVENPSDTAIRNNDKTENLIDKETNIGNVAEQISPGIKQKSPRLLNKSSDKRYSACDQNDSHMLNLNPTILIDKLRIDNIKNCKTDEINDTNAVVSEVNMISSNSEPMKELDSEIDSVKSDNINYSFLKDGNHIKKERQRTKSWTNNLDTPLNDNNFFSDNESVKKKKKIHQSFDIKLLTSLAKQNAYNDTNVVLNSSAKVNNNLSPEKISVDQVDCSSGQNLNLSETEQLMQSFSSKSFKPDICIENLESYNSHGFSIEKNMDDQCVPVVKSNIENQPSVQDKVVEPEVNIFAPINTDLKSASPTNECCVPMDIDETIANSTSLIENERSSMTTQNISDRDYKCVNKHEVSLQSLSRIHDNNENEDKTTLVISEIKDISSKDNSQSIEQPSKSKINEIVANSHPECEIKIFRGFEKEISLKQSTDTPIKDKDSNKLSMKTSTPVTTAITTNKQQSIKTTNNSKTTNDESSSEIDSSDNNSNLLDDKANEAGDDYESGDSQDEEEKMYAKENEIIGKGETLTSDDEISNDSDYEKDSFIVSSDEEDYELLSGSGDNLSLSDNELKLNKKSKEEYNKRKDKERKQFSREMYEARHEVNNTNKKIDRSKRRRLSSSMLDSADESLVKTKKNSISLRVDSYHDPSPANSDFDKSEICNMSAENVEDPLSVTLINNESAKTVVSSSIILPSDTETLKKTNDVNENIEEVQVNENVTIHNYNETRDPLQATVLDEESSLSENEEIKHSYDDVLANLNRNEQGQFKNLELSLDLDVKTNKVSSKSVINERNVTQPKTKEPKSKKELKKTEVNQLNDESSSDCIDFKLLFNEDSSSSQEINDNKENRQEFIPLKKSKGKTNLKHDIDSTINEQAVNTATPKSGKKSKDDLSEFESPKTNEAEGGEMFLIKTSKSNKKKNKLSSQTELPAEETINLGDFSLFKTPKSEKKKVFESPAEVNAEEDEISLIKTPKSNKKKNKLSSQSELPAEDTIDLGDFSLFKTPNSEKKKVTESPAEANADGGEMSMIETSKSNKKKNKLPSQTELPAEETIDLGDFSLFKTPNTEKKKVSESPAEANADGGEMSMIETSKSNKKKNKLPSQTELPAEETIDLGDFSLFKTPNTEKKKVSESPAEANENERQDKGKRGRKISLSTQESTSLVPVDFEQLDVNKPKKRKWEVSMQDEAMRKGVLRQPSNDSLLVVSKKKKQKLSTSEEPTDKDKINGIQGTESVNIKSPTGESSIKSQGKQIPKMNAKKSHIENPSENKRQKKKLDTNKKEVTELASALTNSNEKEKKLKRKPPILSDAVNSQTNVKIKRKKRDEDYGENETKVCKRNVTDQVHVPRLPDFILNQLDDKPTKDVQRKAKIVLTSELSAKQAKNTKPSKFMEKTVCLSDDDDYEDNNRKYNKLLNIPKILPSVKNTKPSKFLETTVCLNDDDDYEDNRKYNKPLKIPKILPSVPFAVTATSGSTTQFQISVLPREIKFVAQSTVSNSFNKNDYLREKQIKQKRKYYELYKNKLKSFKLSKF